MAVEDQIIDDHEQSERVRQWLLRHGNALLIGVLAAIGLVWGYTAWEGRKTLASLEAGEQYEALVKAVADKDLERARALIDGLGKQKNGYAALAALVDARLAVESGDSARAEAALRRAMAAAQEAGLRSVAAIRLARLLLAEGRLDGIDAVLAQIDPEGFKATLAELKGDVEFARSRFDAARAAYDQALAALDVGSPHRQWVEMKRDNASAPTVAQPPAAGDAKAEAAAQESGS